MDDVAFFTIADDAFWVGLVGLVNSLRLTGNHGTLFVLDAGLTAVQREALAPHCTIVDAHRRDAAHPTYFKPFPHLLAYEGTVVILDSDMVITRSLATVVSAARAGRICAFADPNSRRFFEEWKEIHGLKRELRRQTYVSAGFLCFSTEHWPELLPRWWKACEGVFGLPVLPFSAKRNPVALGDQDVLNALLMSEIPGDALALLAAEEFPSWKMLDSVKLQDERTLACSFDGHQTLILHADGNPKPWRPEARWHVKRDPYVRVLRRLLWGEDVALRSTPREEVPIWLRDGPASRLTLVALNAINSGRRFSFWGGLAQRVLPGTAYRQLRSGWGRLRNRGV